MIFPRGARDRLVHGVYRCWKQFAAQSPLSPFVMNSLQKNPRGHAQGVLPLSALSAHCVAQETKGYLLGIFSRDSHTPPRKGLPTPTWWSRLEEQNCWGSRALAACAHLPTPLQVKEGKHPYMGLREQVMPACAGRGLTRGREL